MRRVRSSRLHTGSNLASIPPTPILSGDAKIRMKSFRKSGTELTDSKVWSLAQQHEHHPGTCKQLCLAGTLLRDSVRKPKAGVAIQVNLVHGCSDRP